MARGARAKKVQRLNFALNCNTKSTDADYYLIFSTTFTYFESFKERKAILQHKYC